MHASHHTQRRYDQSVPNGSGAYLHLPLARHLQLAGVPEVVVGVPGLQLLQRVQVRPRVRCVRVEGVSGPAVEALQTVVVRVVVCVRVNARVMRSS
jgi:hypothetical protein